MQRITFDPITSLEGHGKIEIFLNEEGDVSNTETCQENCVCLKNLALKSCLIS